MRYEEVETVLPPDDCQTKSTTTPATKPKESSSVIQRLRGGSWKNSCRKLKKQTQGKNKAANNTAMVGGAVVVFAKCPIPGASKTRLSPLLGEEGAASLARAMLSDILVTLSDCPELERTLKVLMYAPGTKDSESLMISILRSLDISYLSSAVNSEIDARGWHLLPMISPTHSKSTDTHQSSVNNATDLTSSSLGDKLADALERTRTLLANKREKYNNNESVLFLGMDSPEIPIEEVIHGLQISSSRQSSSQQHDKLEVTNGKAHLCPANDGGYGLLSVPIHAPCSIFSGVRWSNHLTAVSQLKAITDAGVDVSLGKLMYDVDEPEDVHLLAERLTAMKETKCNPCERNDVLSQFASELRNTTTCVGAFGKDCPHTLQVMMELGVIK